MRLDLRAVAKNTRRAGTEELLDRVTVYRSEMEPAAVDLIEGELARRGISEDEIEDHARGRRETVLWQPDGTALRCSFCNRPAVGRGRGWYRLFRLVPVVPRVFPYCDTHAPAGRRGESTGGDGPGNRPAT